MNVPLITLMMLGMASGFVPASFQKQASLVAPVCTTSFASNSRLFAGGFGGGGKSGGDKKKKGGSSGGTEKEAKLKPKQQWDRYSAFKKEPKILVGVRCKEDESDEWLEVGRVRSKDSQYTELAVARQRAIIAEVWCCFFLKILHFLSLMAHVLISFLTIHSTPDVCIHFNYVLKSQLNGGTSMKKTKNGKLLTRPS